MHIYLPPQIGETIKNTIIKKTHKNNNDKVYTLKVINCLPFQITSSKHKKEKEYSFFF